MLIELELYGTGTEELLAMAIAILYAIIIPGKIDW